MTRPGRRGRELLERLVFGDPYAPLAARSAERVPGRPVVSHRDKLRAANPQSEKAASGGSSGARSAT